MNKIHLLLLSIAFTVHVTAKDVQAPREVTLEADKIKLAFDKEEFTVFAGESIRLTLLNPEGALQPHNVLIVKPGTVTRVGMLVNRKMSDPSFLQDPNPKTSDVLHASKLLQAGEKDTIEFVAPTEPGDYPYVCTFPGHWAVMKGIMKVELPPDK